MVIHFFLVISNQVAGNKKRFQINKESFLFYGRQIDLLKHVFHFLKE